MIATLRHLTARFVESLRGGEPDPASEAWLLGKLDPNEVELYRSMPTADRRHAVHGARAISRELPDADRSMVVAAALHDVGKTDAHLSTFGRVGATIAGWAITDARAESWSYESGMAGRVGRYLCHSARGARILSEAGAPELAVRWTMEHHWAPKNRSIDPHPAAALDRADRI